MANFFLSILDFDNIHYVQEDIGERGLSFTLYDPAYGGEKFSPAIMGNGTLHKYLLYFDDTFPYVHQNFVKIRLGTSYSVNKGVDAFDTMVQPQGNYVKSTTYYPTGAVQESADDLHTATYLAGSRELNLVYAGALYGRLYERQRSSRTPARACPTPSSSASSPRRSPTSWASRSAY